ncbi:MAG: hypothetical protein K2M12_03340 [Muribaculaceae bacterium]|nr:hypothetical protein [Muribaculaceae bacterium]
MTPPFPTTRVLARTVVYRGQRYPLSIVDLEGGAVRISPFERETPRTVFYPGTVSVVDTPDGPVLSFDVIK